MKCPYCSKTVVGDKTAVMIVGEGPAHKLCYERQIIGQRVFEGLQLPVLSDEQLSELSDMVKMELNSRMPADDIELFA